jgi:hypothetical protein
MAAKDDREIEGFAASVELPEGHQVVIGDMPPGTIVEVATWQGVGRPDDSANRFLITTDGPGLRKREISEPAAAPKPITNESRIAATPELEPVNTTSRDNNFLGMSSERVSKSESREPITKARKSSFSWATFAKSVFTFAAVVSIFAVVLNLLGVSTTIPDRGPKYTFGSVTNSLVFYKRTQTVESGAPMVARVITNGKPEIVVGAATVFDPDHIKIDTPGGLLFVTSNTIIGKSIVAIPYLGSALKVLFN